MTEKVLHAKNYREFIKLAMAGTSRSRAISFAELSRRAGFSSRSYPSDVVNGHRRITAASLPQFIQGLKLTGDFKNYFVLLVSHEEQDINPLGYSREKIEKSLLKVRERMRTGFAPEKQVASSKVYGKKFTLEVYAALGTANGGASLNEIMSRTKLSKEKCATILLEMQEDGLIQYDREANRFFAPESHRIMDKLGDDFFRLHFLESLRYISSEATETAFKKEDRLFLTSVFSISKSQAEKLKKELRDVIIRFADTAEDASGDSIAKVVVGFIPEVKL